MTTNHSIPDLSGRTAVVTGATSGIGMATAQRLIEGGAAVAVLGRREDRLAKLAADLGDRVLPVPADVTDHASLARAADTVHEALGRVDLVVANAGVMLAAPFESADPGEWTTMINTNVTGLLYTGRAFIDDLLAAAADQRPADLVHVGSVGGHIVFPNYSVYTATKAAVAHLTRNLRAELGPRGVRVKNVEPGFVMTELGEGMQDSERLSELAQWRDSMTILEPADIADAIAYAAAAPPHVNIANLVVVPTQQG